MYVTPQPLFTLFAIVVFLHSLSWCPLLFPLRAIEEVITPPEEVKPLWVSCSSPLCVCVRACACVWGCLEVCVCVHMCLCVCVILCLCLFMSGYRSGERRVGK